MKTDTAKILIVDRALELIKTNLNYWDKQKYHWVTTHCFNGFCDLVIKGVGSEQLSNSIYDKNHSNFTDKHPILNYLFNQDNDMNYIIKNIQHL